MRQGHRGLYALVVVVGLLVVPCQAAAAVTSAYVTTAGGALFELNVDAAGILSLKSSPSTPAGSEASGIAVTPNGKYAYVTNSASTGAIHQYTIGPGGVLTPMSPASVPAGQFAQGIAVSPDGKSAYAVAAGSDVVDEFDIGATGQLTPKAGPTVMTGAHPQALAVSPTGANVYVADGNDDTVAEFAVAAGGELSPLGSPNTIAAASSPDSIVISPDGKNVYVGAFNGSLHQFDVGPNGALSAKTPASVSAGSSVTGLAMSPSGTNLYVVAQGTRKLEQFPVGAGGLLASAPAASGSTGQFPLAAAVSPDGRSAYTSNEDSTVSVSEFDIGAGGAPAAKSTPSIALGAVNESIVLPPDQGPVAAVSASPAPTGSPSSFSGSGSSDPDGSIARYDWSFGDGTTLANGGATTTHVYAAPGTYQVTLTVTDDAGCSTTVVFTGQTAYCNGGPAARVTESVGIPAAVQPPPPPPRISGLRVSHRRFARTGRRVGHHCVKTTRANRHDKSCTLPITIAATYSLTRAARVTFTLEQILSGRLVAHRCVAPSRHNRKHPKCRRTLLLRGSLVTSGRAGANRLVFTGRLGHGSLPNGSYELVATVAGGSRATAAFSVSG